MVSLERHTDVAMSTSLPPLVSLERHGDVWVLTLQAAAVSGKPGEFENKFTPALVAAVNGALDEVERDGEGSGSEAERGCALVVTGGCCKFFCNGHDVAWLEASAGLRGTGRGSEAALFIDSFYQLMARFMTFPVPTVAAIGGHAFAGGCLLAMAQDFRVMRADRGFLCMNEVDMALIVSAAEAGKSNVKPGVFDDADEKMTAVLLAKLPAPLVREMYLEGRRYSGKEAKAKGLVDHAAYGDVAVLSKAMEVAGKLAAKGVPHNRQTIRVIKTELVRPYLPLLTGHAANL